MSVINNVLKNLEARETSFTPIEITAVQAPSSAPLRSRLMLLLAGLTIIAAAAFYLLRMMPAAVLPGTAGLPTADSDAAMPVIEAAGLTDRTPALQAAAAAPAPAAKVVEDPPTAVDIPPQPAAASASTTAPLESAAAADPDGSTDNQIVGLQLRETEQAMQMEFVLRDRVVAYLRERGENHFAYRLREIESRIVAPRIRDNRWIRNLSINAAGDGVDIDFETAPDILVEARQGAVDGEAAWIISLRQAAPPQAAVTAPGEPAALPSESATAAPSPVAQPAVAAAADTDSSEADTSLETESVKLEIRATNPNAGSVNRLEYAVELINSRRLGEAETLLRELLGGSEDHAARQRLIALYERDRRPDRALQMAQESLQKYPRDGLFETEYARAMFQQGAYGDVIALLAGSPGPDAPRLALVAASYQRLDQHAEAVRYYRLALAQNAADARNWVGLGISQEHTAALEDALDSYQQAGRLGGLNERLQAFVIQRSDTLRQVLN